MTEMYRTLPPVAETADQPGALVIDQFHRVSEDM
ncbi:hypothetical protein MPTA5024_19565 [Microbispora sp. ATCC PTA-5024]|nr:hypothetical protein MPTA5024_19565 [Microbispora sp. ATCC PTA-5024]